MSGAGRRPRARRVAAAVLGLVLAGCADASSLRPVGEGPQPPSSAPSLPVAATTPRPAPRTRVEAGDRLRREGRSEEALAAYRAARAAAPAAALPHLRYVGLLLEEGRRSEAATEYAARAAAAAATTADRTMAARLATDGSSSALRGVYARAARQEPSNAWWRLALAELEIAETDAWGRSAAEAEERGDARAELAARRQGRAALARADAALDAAAAIAPGAAVVDLYRGLLRAVEGDRAPSGPEREAAYRAAETAFARAVQRDGELVEAWEGLGDVRLRTDDPRGSLVAFHEAARRAPRDAALRMALGGVLQRIGRFDDAAAQYEVATQLEPGRAAPWLRLGDARADAGRWEAALAAYDQALVREGDAIEALFMRGAVFEHLGRYGEALESYQRYLAQDGAREAAARQRVERLLRMERAP